MHLDSKLDSHPTRSQGPRGGSNWPSSIMPAAPCKGMRSMPSERLGQSGKMDAFLAMVFMRLPPSDQSVTVGRLSKHWQQWAAEARAAQRAAIDTRLWISWPDAMKYPGLPQWYVREVFHTLPLSEQRRLVCAVARTGQDEAMHWLLEQASPSSAAFDGAAAAAAAAGHLGLLMLLHASGCLCNARVCEAAAGSGHLAILQWARNANLAWGDSCWAAAGGGHLNVLEWACAQVPPCPWDATACAAAAAGGHLEALQWLRSSPEAPCPLDEWTCAFAARAGHLHVLQWLRHLPPRLMSSNICRLAAGAGQLAVVKWVRCIAPRPCPWNGNACTDAAANGHLSTLQWLRSQKPPCDWGSTCKAAARAGHLQVLIWARAQQPPCPFPNKKFSNGAARSWKPEVVAWALEQGLVD